jgi:hypothetical protein
VPVALHLLTSGGLVRNARASAVNDRGAPSWSDHLGGERLKRPSRSSSHMPDQPSLAMLAGMVVSHVWFGHGSALFVELGELSEGRTRTDGSAGNPSGAVTVMVDSGWRVERARSILAGSGDSKRRMASASNKLLGASIVSAELVGRIPELQLQFSNGLWLVTFSRYEGQPGWAVLFGAPRLGALCVELGRLHVDTRRPQKQSR